MFNKLMIMSIIISACITQIAISNTQAATNDSKPMVVLIGSVTNTMWPITDMAKMEKSALMAKSLGADAFESYTTWANFEPEAPGKFNWTETDKLAEIFKKTGLKWQAFIMLNPSYATPGWYKNSDEDVPHKCLEHQENSDARSIWAPGLDVHLERVLSGLINRYQDNGGLESVMFGVSGDFGESIYPAGAVGWNGTYHNHAGFWCAEEPAVKSFKNWLTANYKTINRLNFVWKTNYMSFDEVKFELPKVKMNDARWMDQSEWYRGEMTNWCETWYKIARKYADPDLPLYLCMGGGDNVLLGFDITGQARLSAKYNIWLRLTNEGSVYPNNFMGTRQFTTAAKLYGIPSGLEPAGAVDERGVTSRIFGAAAAGCNHLHYYEGQIANFNAHERVEARTGAWEREKDHLLIKEPYVNIAAFYPRIDALRKRQMGTESIERYSSLRDFTDFDIIDDNLAKDKKLDRYRYILLGSVNTMDRTAYNELMKWVKNGGVLIANEQNDFRTWKQFAMIPLQEAKPLTKKAGNWAKVKIDMPAVFTINPGQPNGGYNLTGDWSHSEGNFRWGGKNAGMMINIDPDLDYKFTYTGGVPVGGSVLVNGKEIGTMEGGPGNEHTWTFDIPKDLLNGRNIMKLEFDMKPLKLETDTRDLCIYPEKLVFETKNGNSDIKIPVMKDISIDENILNASTSQIGKGCIISMPADDISPIQYAQIITKLISGKHINNIPSSGIVDGKADNLFLTFRGDEILVYNGGTEVMNMSIAIEPGAELDRYHIAKGQTIKIDNLAPDHIEAYPLELK